LGGASASRLPDAFGGIGLDTVIQFPSSTIYRLIQAFQS